MNTVQVNDKVSINVEGGDAQGYFAIDPQARSLPDMFLRAMAPEGVNVLKIEYSVIIHCKSKQLDISSPLIEGHCANGGKIDFKGNYMGGYVVGKARTLIRRDSGASYWSEYRPIRAKIIGRNPSFEQVRAYCASREALVVAYLLSSLKMFDEEGQPYYNGGFGMAQLQAPSITQVWNWRENISACAVRWMTRKEMSRQRPGRMRESNFLKYRHLPDFNEEQIILETYASFNDENYYRPEVFGLLKNQWEWKCASQIKSFADHCLELEKELFSTAVPA